MNKRELIDAITERVGSKQVAAEALDAVLETIQDAVTRGEKVSLVGFGTWERVTRPARDARNPATGETIRVPETNVPKFKVGATFKDQVAARRQA
jgi:DNA-binding protein HU-beta